MALEDEIQNESCVEALLRPAENEKWRVPIKDDPVVQSNKQWTMSYATAGMNTRTAYAQLFINFNDNSKLDNESFALIGEVVSGHEFCECTTPRLEVQAELTSTKVK